MNKNKKTAGFTLIELLVVMGIIAVIATIVLVAINPARQFAQARNTQRTSDATVILNAIGQNLADNKGVFACSTGATLSSPTASSTITTGTVSGTLPTGLATPTKDLSCLAPTYVSTFPLDPDSAWLTGGSAINYTGYEVSVDSNGRVLICSPRSLNETTISTPGPTICVKR